MWRLVFTSTFTDNFTHVVRSHMSLEIAANTQKHICSKINFLYSIPNISYVITSISVLIFKQDISKCCFFKKCMYCWGYKPKFTSVTPVLTMSSFIKCKILISYLHFSQTWKAKIDQQKTWWLVDRNNYKQDCEISALTNKLTPRLTQSLTQQSYNWYNMTWHFHWVLR